MSGQSDVSNAVNLEELNIHLHMYESNCSGATNLTDRYRKVVIYIKR